MDTQNSDPSISALLEMMPMYHKIVLNEIEMKSIHLTKSPFFILLALMSNESLNMTQVATYIASSKEQATRAVAPLVEAGYVDRFHDESNRKLVLIRLTPSGKTFLHETKEHLHQSLEKKFERLPIQDRQDLGSSPQTILRILKKMQE